MASNSLEGRKLWEAAAGGDFETVRTLCENESVDVNWQDELKGRTPLLRACGFGHLAIVKYLLNHPRIDVGLTTESGATPFLIACQQGHVDLVTLLLDDQRVDVECMAQDDTSPLWFASQNGHLGVVRHLLASGKEIKVSTRSAYARRTPAEQCRWAALQPIGANILGDDPIRRATNNPVIADLLDLYDLDPPGVTQALRRHPDISASFAARAFALVVFYTDSFIAPGPNVSRQTKRFFEVCSRLPLELQMVICNRLFGSPLTSVLSKDSEPAFMWLARPRTWLEFSPSEVTLKS